jgi:hypothetical protein
MQLHNATPGGKCLSGGPKTFFEPYSLKKEEKIFRTVTLKKIVRRISPHPCLLSPNIINSCFLGPPVANFGPSMTEARGNLSNELAKMLWSFFPLFLDTRTPSSYATAYIRKKILYVLYNLINFHSYFLV